MNKKNTEELLEKNFYLQYKQDKHKAVLIRNALIWFIALFLIITTFTLINCSLTINKDTTNLGDIFKALFTDWTKSDEAYNVDFDILNRAAWITSASFVAGFALAISAAIVQSITMNPLCDSTTLGMVDATIFGIILMKTFFSGFLEGDSYHYYYLIFAFFGSATILFFLFLLFNETSEKKQYLKIILLGMILNIFFRTLNHAIKEYNSNTSTSIFMLMVGGAENSYKLFPNQFSILKITSFFVFTSFLASLIISKKLNICELGEHQSKSLGVNYTIIKTIGFLIILFCTFSAIVLAGNIAFIGLMSVHISRIFLKTRRYEKIIPFSAILSGFLMVICVMFHFSINFIPSSIFTLIFGSICLLYLSYKGQ